MKKIVLADDHELILDGLTSLLENEPNLSIIATAMNGHELLEIIEEIDEVDAIILDINMPKMDGIEVTKWLKGKYPEIKIIILSMYKRSEFVKNLLKAGADGYILKNSGREIFIEAITAVCAGKRYFSQEVLDTVMESFTEERLDKDLTVIELTEREKEVVRLIAQEKSTAEIADVLNLSAHTINSHRKSILNKIGVKNATGIFRYAIQTGIVKGFDL